MLLALDVGNTNITIGCFKDDKFHQTWRISTPSETTPDEIGLKIYSLISISQIKSEKIEEAVISSVVPYINKNLSAGLNQYLGIKPNFLQPLENGIVDLEVQEPQAVGPDRVANIIAGLEHYGGPGLIIDFGTATSFELYSEQGNFLGGAISPEMETTLESLVKKAALLPEVELKLPTSPVGKTTEANINSGFVLGFISMVEGMIKRFIKECDQSNLEVIATGGNGKLFFDQIDLIKHYEQDLVLEGLKLWWEKKDK